MTAFGASRHEPSTETATASRSTHVGLDGAADLHCHFGPDPRFERTVDALGAARDAAAAGHAAVVLKSHDEPTASLAHAVDEMVEGVAVYGGVCCDREIGGLNPVAVEVALRLGAKIVWLPTLSSQQDVENGLAAYLGMPLQGLRVIDDDGALLPDTQHIIDLVGEHGAVLATGHISTEEHFAVAQAAVGRASVLATHVREGHSGPDLSIEECRALADLGVTLELVAATCLSSHASRSLDDVIDTIKAIGPEHFTLATDYGGKGKPRPAPGFASYVDELWSAGVSERDLRCMACDNPQRLLGLS
jgi:hypothetical protein